MYFANYKWYTKSTNDFLLCVTTYRVYTDGLKLKTDL